MNKVVLVIDEPRSCGSCRFSHYDEHPDHWCCGACNNYEKTVDLNNPLRPEWCPLKPVPKKITGDNSIKYQLGDYEDGWNHCLDMILDDDESDS